MTEKKGPSENKNDEDFTNLSLVDTDYKTGSLDNVKIESEKSIAPPSDSLNFEFDSADENPTSPVIDTASLVEELEKSFTNIPVVTETISTEPNKSEVSFQDVTTNNVDIPDSIPASISKTQSAAFGSKEAKIAPQSNEPKNNSKTFSKQKLSIGVTGVALCLAVGLFLFSSPSKNPIEPNKNAQLELLLKQQNSIKSEATSETAKINADQIIEKISHWSGSFKSDAFSFTANISVTGEKVTDISFLFQEKEPPKLSPKQIVDKVAEPIWMDRFELAENISEKNYILSNFSVSGLAYLKQRNSNNPSRRVVATAKFSGTIDSSHENLVLDWEIAPGNSSAENSPATNSSHHFSYSNKLTLTPTVKDGES